MSNFGWSLNVKVWGKDIIDFSIFYPKKNGGSFLIKFKKPVFFCKNSRYFPPPTFGYLILRIVLKKTGNLFENTYMIKSKINKCYFSERFVFFIPQPLFVYKQKNIFFKIFKIWTERELNIFQVIFLRKKFQKNWTENNIKMQRYLMRVSYSGHKFMWVFGTRTK